MGVGSALPPPIPGTDLRPSDLYQMLLPDDLYHTSPKELCPLFCARKEVLARRYKEKNIFGRRAAVGCRGVDPIYPITVAVTPRSQIQQLEVKAAGLQPVLQMRESLSGPFPPQPLTTHQFYDLNKTNLCSREFFCLGIHECNPE